MGRPKTALKQAAVLAVLTMVALTAASFTASGRNGCAEAQAWVENHLGELPESYQGISALPPTYRRAIFSALPPQQKSALRQEHLEARWEQNPEWTPRQRDIVRQARALFTPAFFSRTPQDLLWNTEVAEPFQALRSRALAVFSQREFQGIFVELGKPEISYNSPQTFAIYWQQGARNLFSDADEVESFPCNCNLALDNNCVTTNCTPKATGCGPNGTSRCNGHYAALPDPRPIDP